MSPGGIMESLRTDSPSAIAMPAWKRRILTAVSIAIFAMIGRCNLPEEWCDGFFSNVESASDAQIAYRARQGDWAMRYAAHVVGVDGKWQMYGGQSRFNWRYIITAVYGDDLQSEEIVLPLPRQTDRTSLACKFADFKEAKFLLNIYNDEMARETYARYLARQYATHDGLPISRIRYTLAIQHILPPIVAMREQRLLEPDEICDVINDFDVTMERNRASGSVSGLFD